MIRHSLVSTYYISIVHSSRFLQIAIVIFFPAIRHRGIVSGTFRLIKRGFSLTCLKFLAGEVHPLAPPGYGRAVALSSKVTPDTQCDQKVSVHLMITIQKVTSNVQSAWRPTARARGTPDSH
jgi:hypothetical protein